MKLETLHPSPNAAFFKRSFYMRWGLLTFLSATSVLSTVSRAQLAPATGAADAKGVNPPVRAVPLPPEVGRGVPAAAPDSDLYAITQLSPFQVNESQDRGYFASSTLSGTRLNTSLADVAASISVVTKQQLADTAATDINDIFKYEAGTEGIYQWTSFSINKGDATDEIAANPTGATRMRGLSAANVSTSGFATALPFDTYNVDAVEITRGPNSSLFGLGNAGGSVNIIASRANLNRETTSFGSRGDSYGGYRANFDVNRPIFKHRLALRVLGLYDEKAFERKPSADVTRRLQLALTARPLANTTLRGSFESYRNFNQRPNSTTPRDMTSDWVTSGRPTYDPFTQTVHFGDGRPAVGPVTTAQQPALLPFSIATFDSLFFGRPSWYIDRGRLQLYTINGLPATSGTAFGPDSTSTAVPYLLQNSTFYLRNTATYPLYLTRGITNRSLYDWTSINLLAPNYAAVRGETSSLELEQFFLRTSRQTLALQAGWLNERMATRDRSFLAKAESGKNQVYIDINEKLLDGTVNPYLLRPYLYGTQPIFRRNTNNNEFYRGTLAYQLDFSMERDWRRWLGRQNFTGYGEYRSNRSGNLGFSDGIVSTEAWMQPISPSMNRTGGSFRINPRFYVGGPNGGRVEYAPARAPEPAGTYPLRYFNRAQQQWIDEPVEVGSFYTSGTYSRRLLGTTGAIWQGSFLQGRVLPLFGARQDSNRTRQGNRAVAPSGATLGFFDTSNLSGYDQNDWLQRRGTTTNAGLVVKALKWLHLTYSQSNSFNPSTPVYDVYWQPLPDPRGRTRDYGFDLELFRDSAGRPRLNIRAKQYETIDSGRSTGDIPTVVVRTLRLDYYPDGAASFPELEQFFRDELTKLHPNWSTTETTAEVVRLMGVDPHIGSAENSARGDADNATSRGKEIEIAVNPVPGWTLKATVTQAQSFNGLVSEKLQSYLKSRLAVWTSARSPYDGSPYWNGNYRIAGNTPESYYTQSILGPLRLAVASQGKRRTQTREWRANLVTNYQLASITDQRWLKRLSVGGALRWESRGSIGFHGAPADADGIVRALDPNQPVWDKARYYIDLMASYDLRLFRDRIRARLQLNVRDVLEDGRLQPLAVNPDGRPWAYRIIDPRQFVFSATFSL
jgi:TonB-dependent Receptor Plug Domain